MRIEPGRRRADDNASARLDVLSLGSCAVVAFSVDASNTSVKAVEHYVRHVAPFPLEEVQQVC